ncbi:DUF1961 family protein [Flammeovirga sp. OC4]|uniref:DUF1961 family protein n=1 Tax=Flammeovirga sp. OC4 TaxID=1382345 RepID=UPI0005C4AADB|nr:DUF1961 family protein [Flammeovirga sp. OC4]
MIPIKHIFTLLLSLTFLYCSGQKTNQKFDDLNKSKQWDLVFKDNCKKDWTQKWTLDGQIATVENTNEGMHFSAGPEAKNDAHHAVLWTKESFEGDIKIEYDYTRTDTANKYVTILYIQATGDGEDQFVKDISEWEKFREVPAMRKYFENMNLLHISYAAFGNDGSGFYYVRSRRYPKPKNKGFNTIRIDPSYDYKGFMKTGQKYHVVAIKSGSQLYFKITSEEGEEELFTWDLSGFDPITEGRIGLRHMYTRSAIYKNFKIYTN